jgi:hypothetical protein
MMRFDGSDFVLVLPLNEKPTTNDPQRRSTITVFRDSRIYWRRPDTAPLKHHMPDYLGFRYDKTLQSVRPIVDCERLIPGSPSRLLPGIHFDDTHIVFKLGGAIDLGHEVKSGQIFHSGPQWCTLASLRKYKTVGEAVVNPALAVKTPPLRACT